ncbi:uncharacterized protein [Mytilus edulis]|uniref:uncharacterized protein n=1 Tax=Mytilus edulis TaxID=6550 RepID=UPI0039EEC541
MKRDKYRCKVYLAYLMLFVSSVGMVNSCFFYPINGIITNWYRTFRGHGILESLHAKRCLFVKHGSLGWKDFVLIRHPAAGQIWVKKDRGHCGILDCCGIHQPVYNYCMLNRCQNGGKCINNNDGYTCMCHKGYTGNTCEHGPITKAAVATTSKPTSTCVDSSFCYTSAACFLVPDSCPNLCGKCGKY